MPWEGYMVLSASTVESFLSFNKHGVAFSFQTNVYNIVCWDVCAVSQAACTTSYDHIVAAVFNTYLCLLKETVLEVGERKIQTRERVPDNSMSHFPEIMTITLLCDWIFFYSLALTVIYTSVSDNQEESYGSRVNTNTKAWEYNGKIIMAWPDAIYRNSTERKKKAQRKVPRHAAPMVLIAPARKGEHCFARPARTALAMRKLQRKSSNDLQRT